MTNDNINFEVCYDYLVRELIKNLKWTILVLQKIKINNKIDIFYANRILNELNNIIVYARIYETKLKINITSIKKILTHRLMFLRNNFKSHYESFYSIVINELFLVYAPNSTFLWNEFTWNVWFKIQKDPVEEVIYLNFYCDKPDRPIKYPLIMCRCLINFKYKSFRSKFIFDKQIKNSFYTRYTWNDNFIETEIFFLIKT